MATVLKSNSVSSLSAKKCSFREASEAREIDTS